ncbi:BRCT domain-containing protein [Paenibacillus phoenicis]|uniref:BRCT domain-containing protein n=1 Tax=Paenibacillus phoenicis TaxID=554117 RepID=UPI003D283BB7
MLKVEEMSYAKFMSKANFEKALNSLIGIIQGISADKRINSREIEELQNWCLLQSEFQHFYPFKEIIPLVKESVLDGILTQDEIDDISWLCNNYLQTNHYYDAVTSDFHTLHGILYGIITDGTINYKELEYLKEWLDDHDHLETMFPYDEVYSLLHTVMKDGKLDSDEERLLKAFFADFVDTSSSYNINATEIQQLKKEMNISGICALGPNIEFEGKMFCFTGVSNRMKRSEIEEIILSRGGLFNNSVTKKTNYLIVGAAGNPCWAFSCYGRKIEQAINLRKQGMNIVIANELDFWDAIG